MKTIQFIYTILFVCFTNMLRAQEPILIHLTEKEGLPDVEFFSMVEDKEGFIWLAANKGLFRYDGKEFKEFSHPKKRGQAVFYLQLDSKGRVWLNNLEGQFFYVENNELILFKDFKSRFEGRLPVFNFFNQKLVIKDTNSIFSVDVSTKKEKILVTDLEKKYSFSVKNTRLTYIDSKDNIIFLDKNIHEKKYSIKSEKNSVFELFGNCKFATFNDRVILISRNTLALKTHLFIHQKSSSNFLPILLPKELENILIEKIRVIDNEFYIATNKGLFVAKFVANTLEIITHFSKNKFITDIIKDTNDNIWITTLNKGVYIIPNKNIKMYSKQSDMKILEKKNDTSCFVGTEKGSLLLFNLKNKRITTIFKENNKKIKGLNYNQSTQKMFYASKLKTFRYNEITKKRKYLKNSPNTKSISYCNDSTYIISVHNGTFVTQNLFQKETFISKIRSYKSVYSKKSKKIYIADIEGLKVFDKISQKYQEILWNKKPIQAFNIVETLDGSLWVTTHYNGILKIRNNNVVGQFNIFNGLVSSNINQIIADGNALWIVTNKGLQYYNDNTKENNVLTQKDGVNYFTIRDMAVVGNHILYANELGLYGFDKTNIFKQHKIPKVYITNAFVEDTPVNLATNYVLTHDKNNFKINFNVKKFQSIKHIVYEYKLHENDTWKTVEEGIDFIRLISLPIGEYALQLRAKNKFQKKYSELVTVQIKVLAPFYQRWWFYTIMSILLLAVIYFIGRRAYRARRKKVILKIKELQIEKQFSDLKLENLRSQMNPHFIFNSLNSIQALVLRKETKKAYDYIVVFSELVRKTLLHSEKDFIKLSEEVDFLQIYLSLESLRMKEEFSYEFINEIDENIKIPSLLIQPFLENAIRHGLLHKEGAKKLTILFKITEEGAVCIVEDNGVGRERAKEIKKRQHSEHLSFSLNATEQRLRILSNQNQKIYQYTIEDLFDENKIPAGTKIIILFPFKHVF